MLLRRVIEQVNAQNWFAVGIDLVIVVVGVFIGIQVANWNDSIADDRKAERMQNSILVDLENEKRNVDAIRQYWATTVAYAEVAVIGFQDDERTSDKQFVISAYQASQAIFPSSNRATYEQMLASGNISVSGSDELKNAIVTYYVSDWTQIPDNASVTPYRANIRRSIPHHIQASIREHCGDRVSANEPISLPKKCDIEISSEDVTETAAYLRQRPELLLDLRHHLSDLSAKMQNLDELDIRIDNIVSLAAKGQ